MDFLSVVLVVCVLGASLAGTSLIVRLVNGQLSQLRGELRELRDKHIQLLNEYEKLRKEVSELREALSRALNKQDSLEDRVLVVEKLVKEGLGTGEKVRSKQRGGDADPHIDLKVLALRKEGLSVRQIARKLGISKSKVHRIIKRAYGQ